MKRLLTIGLLIVVTGSGFCNEMQNYKKDSDAIWRTGVGAEDGTFTAVSTSMLGWGLGLSVGIAVLASVLHQSSASHSTVHSQETD